MVNQACEVRHNTTKALLRYLITGVLMSLAGLGSLYLYAAEKYSTKEDVKGIRQEMRILKSELRSDMKEGFARIEKHLKP